ncbi:MAG: hypothetical protein JO001_25075 [Alphaproteobacteria bacterium]|nr:hypothetical protein [Alphaproteobacteria bacterium]
MSKDLINAAVVEIFGRNRVIASGSKLFVLPTGSILVCPPPLAEYRGNHGCLYPVEYKPNGDDQTHTTLMNPDE